MTQINKELLERYELGQCTDQERKLVLDWLDNEDWDQLATEESQAHITNEKGKQIWADLDTFIEKEEQRKNKFSLKTISSIAATIVFLALGYSLLLPSSTEQELNNSQYSIVDKVTHPFTLILGEDSHAHINIQTGDFTLTGEVLFTPNQDLTLQYGKQSNLFFKAGETYYLSESSDSEHIIIVKKEDFTFLPPIVQKQLRKKFQIS